MPGVQAAGWEEPTGQKYPMGQIPPLVIWKAGQTHPHRGAQVSLEYKSLKAKKSIQLEYTLV